MTQSAAHDDRFEGARSHRTRLCDLRLTIQGTPLEPVIDEFKAEVDRLNLRVRPHFYLSTDWGVPFPSVSIGIPFYLAHPDLTALHAQRVGHVEGVGRINLLRYLRHEMGHVVNYAYRLYDQEAWVRLFGPITRPYLEDYTPEPFSRRFVRHLPGWYAQKHPDEDWSETFAVWMTPGRDWRQDYADWPQAMAKLEYCHGTMAALSGQEPHISHEDADDQVCELPLTPEQFYESASPGQSEFPPGLDGALRAVFEDQADHEGPHAATAFPASQLIHRHEIRIVADVFQWTGHFPERTRLLLRHLAQRADAMEQVYPGSGEVAALVSLTTLVTSLAMNHVHRGAYLL